MSEPYIGEIRIFPYNFTPVQWAWCDGQLLPISQFKALFTILGTTYGGDGTSTFALPNLQGRSAVGWTPPGQVPPSGQSSYALGATGGAATVPITIATMPAHVHTLNASVEDGTQGSITAGISLASSSGGMIYQTGTQNLQEMNPQALAITSGDIAHDNMMPYLTIGFAISLAGIYSPPPSTPEARKNGLHATDPGLTLSESIPRSPERDP